MGIEDEVSRMRFAAQEESLFIVVLGSLVGSPVASYPLCICAHALKQSRDHSPYHLRRKIGKSMHEEEEPLHT